MPKVTFISFQNNYGYVQKQLMKKMEEPTDTHCMWAYKNRSNIYLFYMIAAFSRCKGDQKD